MRIHLLTALLAIAATGCIYDREVVRERPAQVSAPPPPPSEDGDEGRDVSTQVASAQPAPPAIEREVDTEVFYERLSPYGHWQYVEDYGRVWVPTVAVAWRPYYYGHWVLTDWGWTFASEDPWGWAAYHYGSWGFGPGLGWYWVPGRIWAPAWVSWRYGGGYATWCPIGPRGYVYGYNSPAWVAVREEHFTQPIATVAVGPRATPVAVQGASPLAGPHASPVKGGSFGPPVARVSAATGQQFHPVSAASVVGRPRAMPAGTAQKIDRMGGPGPRASGSGGDATRPQNGATGLGRPSPVEPGQGPRPRAGAPTSGGRPPAVEGGPRATGGGAGRTGGGSARPGEGSGRPGEGAPRPAGGPRPTGGGRSSGGEGGNRPTGGAPRPSGGGGGGNPPAPSGGGGGSHPAPSGGGGGSHPAPAPSGGGHASGPHRK